MSTQGRHRGSPRVDDPPAPPGAHTDISSDAQLRSRESSLLDTLELLWRNGWQPAEVARQARINGSTLVARLVRVAVLVDHDRRSALRIDPRWQAQIDGLSDDRTYPASDWLDRWRRAEVLTVLAATRVVDEAVPVIGRVTHLDELIPPPGGPVRPAVTPVVDDDPMLAKVRALLTKAESTDSEPEATALTAKAHELMTRHAIDLARLHPETAGDAPGMMRVPIEAPYRDAKSWLLQVVAEASRCRTVYHPTVALSTIIGEPPDLAAVELLFGSLLVQADHALREAADDAGPGTPPRSPAYRSSFLLSFTDRVGERLRGINEQLYDASAPDSSAFLPTLRAQAEAIADLMDERFPGIQDGGVRGSYDAAGWAGGRMAGETARLGSSTELS